MSPRNFVRDSAKCIKISLSKNKYGRQIEVPCSLYYIILVNRRTEPRGVLLPLAING